MAKLNNKTNMIKYICICSIMQLVLISCSFFECEYNVEVRDFYVEENPISADDVTQVHIVLDQVYGPILLTTDDQYRGFFIKDSEYYKDVWIFGHDDPKSDHYIVKWKSPSTQSVVKMQLNDMQKKIGNPCREIGELQIDVVE